MEDQDWLDEGSAEALLPFEADTTRSFDPTMVCPTDDQTYLLDPAFGVPIDEDTFDRGAAVVYRGAAVDVHRAGALFDFGGEVRGPDGMAPAAQPKQQQQQLYDNNNNNNDQDGFSFGSCGDFAFAPDPQPPSTAQQQPTAAGGAPMMSASQLFGSLPGVEVLDSLDAPPPSSSSCSFSFPPPAAFNASAGLGGGTGVCFSGELASPVPKQQSIQPLSKCPIKSYTTLNVKKDCDPCLITSKMQSMCLTQMSGFANVDCQMLQEGVKLKGSVGVPRGGAACDESALDAGGGSFFFVFQLFWKKGVGVEEGEEETTQEDQELVCVWRRLCGDPVAFNDYYRKAVAALRADADLAPFLLSGSSA